MSIRVDQGAKKTKKTAKNLPKTKPNQKLLYYCIFFCLGALHEYLTPSCNLYNLPSAALVLFFMQKSLAQKNWDETKSGHWSILDKMCEIHTLKNCPANFGQTCLLWTCSSWSRGLSLWAICIKLIAKRSQLKNCSLYFSFSNW